MHLAVQPQSALRASGGAAHLLALPNARRDGASDLCVAALGADADLNQLAARRRGGALASAVGYGGEWAGVDLRAGSNGARLTNGRDLLWMLKGLPAFMRPVPRAAIKY